MNRYTSRERAKLLGEFVVETGATVRHTASVYGISKSTVHKDLTERLKYIDPALFKEVKRVLDNNKAERHLRGGEATRLKYRRLKKRLI
ncbi:MAG: sporulation transcriptional regulator SpoIIID [Clostridia bacterium]|nr:sporulation transcriptional regulator SpoIIID [Clostridia bacterium]